VEFRSPNGVEVDVRTKLSLHVNAGVLLVLLMDPRTETIEDPRFGRRGRPAFLITTELFLRRFGLASLAASHFRRGRSGGRRAERLRAVLAEGDNDGAGRTNLDGN
jgi:hypothetical protein